MLEVPEIDKYNPEQIKKEAEDFAESEIKAGADRLIASSPTAQRMRENYEEVSDKYLRGLPDLDLNALQNMSVGDAEEIAKIIFENVAREHGIPITSLDMDQWVSQGLDYLKEQGKELLADLAAEAMAQYGVQGASQIASDLVPYVGMATTTVEALEDGKLTQGEVMSISTTAMTSASTMLAGTAVGAGLGVVGAVFAPAAIGTALFEGQNAAQQEYRRQVRLAAQKQTRQEEEAINAWLSAAQAQYFEGHQELWDRKDSAVALLANNWSTLENQVQSKFELRFFPGAPPPLRGGWYLKQPLVGNQGFYMKKRECRNIAGCAYFPGNSVRHSLAEFIEIATEMKKHNYVLGRNGDLEAEYYERNPYHVPPYANNLYGGPDYAYYWRAMRAFNALAPSKKDLKNLPASFWVPPGHEFRRMKPFKDYGMLGWDLWYRYAPQDAVNACPYTGCTLAVMSREGTKAVARNKNDSVLYGTRAWDMAKEAQEYVDEVFDKLHAESQAVDAYRTRLHGDLLQTAAAVRGEQATKKRLIEIGSMQAQAASTKEQKEFKVLDDQTRYALGALESRRDRINNAWLFAGGSALAAAWYFTKGR